MHVTPRTIQNLKQSLLVVSVLYFYTLAFALGFQKPTLGMDRPEVFLSMSGLFLFALVLEMLLAFWNQRAYLLWGSLAIAAYGVLGFIVAPSLYGSSVVLFALVEPIVIVFVGGFAFSAGSVLANFAYASVRLSPSQADLLLTGHPGWKRTDLQMMKTYAFRNFAEALNFTNRVARLVERTHHYPYAIELSGSNAAVIFASDDGLTLTDIRHAQKIDTLADRENPQV